MNIDEIIDGLQRTIEELKEERKNILRLEESAASLITMANLWFEQHGHDLPEYNN